jgi:glucose-fructose oxidoreductase
MPRQVRYAVVGLGHIAQTAVLPAFAHAKKNSRLEALVSDDPRKLRALGRRHRVERLVDYDGLDELLASGDVDAVYIALPNHLHAEFTLRAARAGVHVLCEKPLAPTSAECERMLEATDDAGVKLMTAYRLHFHPANLEAVKLARSRRLGELRAFSSSFGMQVRPGNIRVEAELGGGPLLDLGIYCVNAARYLFGAEPLEVQATATRSSDPRFAEVPEMVSATLRFPQDRVAQFTCSFGSADTDWYELVGTRGSLRLDPAYSHSEAATLVAKLGRTRRTRRFAKSDQFAPEILHFSACILADRTPGPSGLEGAIDVAILEAIQAAARSGASVPLSLPAPERRPDPARAHRSPAPRRDPAPVHAEEPHLELPART